MSISLLAVLAVAVIAARAMFLWLCSIVRTAARKPATWAAILAVTLAAAFPLASAIALCSVTAIALVFAFRALMPPLVARSMA